MHGETTKQRLRLALQSAFSTSEGDNGSLVRMVLTRDEIELLLKAVLADQFTESLTQMLIDSVTGPCQCDSVGISDLVEWMYSDIAPADADPDDQFLGTWFQDAPGVTLRIVRAADGRLRASWEAYTAILQRQNGRLEGQGVLPTGSTDKVFSIALQDAETLSVQIRTPKLAYPPRLARRVPRPEVTTEGRYVLFDPIWEALADRSTVLVKGSWLLSQSTLPRRQDLPAGSTWDLTHLRPRVEAGDVRLAALSHCWMHADHPDPDGRHLAMIQAFITQRLNCKYPDGSAVLDDFAVFIDWCGLYQRPFEAESARVDYEKGLANIDVWYVHQGVEFWLIEDATLDGRSYNERGWPEFEKRASSMMKPGHMVHDLLGSGKMGRMPPLSLGLFSEVLQRRSFANEADRGFVEDKYRDIFTAVLSNVRVLSFRGLQWDDADIATLAPCLPHCQHLESLDLGKNAFGKEGCAALAAVLPQCSKLAALRFDSTVIGDAGIEVLAPELPQCRSLREFSLSFTGAGNAAARALAGALPRCPVLENVRLDNNSIGDAGATVLCTAFPYCTSLKVLELSENKLSESMMVQAQKAWQRAGKPVL